MSNRKVRVVVTINIPSDLDSELLVMNQQFTALAGKAVQAVAATVNDANPDPRWNESGYHTTVHVHDGDNGCSVCRTELYHDGIV